MKHHTKATHEHINIGLSDLSLTQFLVQQRRSVYKLLFAERAKEIIRRAKAADARQIAVALKGNSTRKLAQTVPYIPFPLAVNDLDEQDKLICDPEGVKATTMEYFRRLYDHSHIPDIPKPWMETPSVREVRQRVSDEPFSWPRKASLADFRALLRRGNNRPAPGPDSWEKWTIKSLSDKALSLVLDLHNYQVINSRFPGDIKDMWLTMFHKRNLRTDLQNWRGLLLSNVLANSPMAWLNFCLIRYSSQKRILPDTQVATQPGVQTRDLMSFLGGIKCWAHRHKETVFAIKRDQMKGFDYLSPDGFYDAIRAYGLPEAIIDLDRAAQTDTRCFIRTAYGVTDPITVSGVNKQGGAASPLKSTFTTSLGSYYLNDILQKDKDALIITTSSMERDDPHLKDASARLLVGMVEATDDSYIFSKSLKSLISNTLEMERFQYAYGWMTQWSKSRAFVIGGTEIHHNQVSFESVTTGSDSNPMDVTEHQVELIDDDLDFLQTKVDNPTARFEELKCFIETFKFPTIIGRLPITLIRKIVSQNIISRCRALLSLQPIKHSDAQKLDNMVIKKVHEALGFPFQPNTSIAVLPVTHHGLGFPSIARINTALAIEGLARDLNHHIPAYKIMATITLADWTCEKNGCRNPLDGPGLGKDFTGHLRSIPAAWILAQKAMKDLSLSLREIDQSYLTEGYVSITHLIRAGCPNNSQITKVLNGTTLRPLGIKQLRDVGTWVIDDEGKIVVSLTRPNIDRTWSTAARLNWNKLEDVIHGKLQLKHVINGSIDLAIPKTIREANAESLIRTLANICRFERSKTADDSTWASDGSMLPASAYTR
jgi:hypothetical protein